MASRRTGVPALVRALPRRESGRARRSCYLTERIRCERTVTTAQRAHSLAQRRESQIARTVRARVQRPHTVAVAAALAPEPLGASSVTAQASRTGVRARAHARQHAGEEDGRAARHLGRARGRTVSHSVSNPVHRCTERMYRGGEIEVRTHERAGSRAARPALCLLAVKHDRARPRRCATLARSQTMRPMVLARAQQRQPLCAAAGHALGWYRHFGSLDVERVSARAVRS